MNNPDSEAITATLALMPHPEGGWYRETFRHVLEAGGTPEGWPPGGGPEA